MAEYPGNYVMYLRKSRADQEAEQRGEGETLSRHERALTELAARLRLPLGSVYREIVSGETIAARPVMRKLLSEVEDGLWDGVFVMEIERLARGDTIDQGLVARAFQLSGTKIITPSKTYDPRDEFDEEYFEFGLFMSRREYKTIQRRLQRGRLASVREGKYAASVAPYGYARKKLKHDKGYILVPNPEQAAVVRLIFALYTSGETGTDGAARRLGVSLIARRLNEWKIPPPKGEVWSPASIRDMLSNPVYIGKLRWNWRKEHKRRENGQIVVSRPRSPEQAFLADGRHEGIVQPEVFQAAREFLSQNHAPAVREKGVTRNPLAGLVICGNCGRRMQRRPYLKKGLAPSVICIGAACGNASCPLELLESRILAALRPWLEDYRIVWRGEETRQSRISDVRQEALARLDREIAALRRQRENLYDLLERGVYDTETFWERGRALAVRIEAAERGRDALAGELARRENSRKPVLPKAASLLELYGALTPAGQNFLLKEILVKALYRKEAASRWTCPDRFSLDLFPKLPPPASLRREL